MTYGILRRKSFGPEKVGLALAAVSVLVYGALGVLFAGSLAYMFLIKSVVRSGVRLIGRFLRGRRFRSTLGRAETWSAGFISRLGEQLRYRGVDR